MESRYSASRMAVLPTLFLPISRLNFPSLRGFVSFLMPRNSRMSSSLIMVCVVLICCLVNVLAGVLFVIVLWVVSFGLYGVF